MCLRVPVYFGVHACVPARGHSRVRHMYVYTCFFLFLFARETGRASEQASERANALARAFLLIGKYRNARNIEHLDGTASMPLPHPGGSTGPGGTGRNRRGGARVWVGVGVGVATIFSTTGLCHPTVLVKRIRRLSRDWGCERRLARFFVNSRSPSSRGRP